MITLEEAEERINNEGLEAIRVSRKCIVIPAFGFTGGVIAQRGKKVNGKMVMENVRGVCFHNPKDALAPDELNQVLKAKDGILLCYDVPGRVEKINSYLSKHRDALKTNTGVEAFIKYLSEDVVKDSTGKADLWDSDLDYIAALKDAPMKETIKPGQVFVGAKAHEVVDCAILKPGEVFQGAIGKPQMAGLNGAYLVRDMFGIRLAQADIYELTPASKVKVEEQKKLVTDMLGKMRWKGLGNSCRFV